MTLWTMCISPQIRYWHDPQVPNELNTSKIRQIDRIYEVRRLLLEIVIKTVFTLLRAICQSMQQESILARAQSIPMWSERLKIPLKMVELSAKVQNLIGTAWRILFIKRRKNKRPKTNFYRTKYLWKGWNVNCLSLLKRKKRKLAKTVQYTIRPKGWVLF